MEESAGHMMAPALLLGMMLHATGDMKSKHRSKIPWRNFYVANTDSLESEGWLFLVGLGLAVGFVAISLFLPLFDLTSMGGGG